MYYITAIILAAVLGLCVGSFLNVCVYRIPNGISLSKPASHCPNCKNPIRWYDNIPVISFLVLGGKCRHCKQKISPRYMLVELVNGILWVGAVLLFWKTEPVYAVLTAVASSVALCVFCTDLEYMIIPDRYSLILAGLGVVAMFFDPTTVWWSHLVGGAVAAGMFLLVYYLAAFIYKKEALGGGDVKFSAAAGLFLGWQKFLFMLLVAALVASVVLLAVRLAKKQEQDKEYPFAPFLSAGFVLAMAVGAQVIAWYVGLLTF